MSKIKTYVRNMVDLFNHRSYRTSNNNIRKFSSNINDYNNFYTAKNNINNSLFSNEHILYEKKIKRQDNFITFAQIMIVISLIIVWQLLIDFNFLDSFIYSSPKSVIDTLINLHNTNNLYNHIWVTIYETIISFGLGTILGIFIATILWWNKYLYRIFDPYLTMLNSLPKVALGPIIIIVSGAGIKSIIIMALFISLIITIINVYQGFNEIDEIKIKLLKSFGATKKQIYSKLIIPGSIPNFINALKINISMSLIGVIMGEFLVSKEGIGYLIMYGSQVFNINLVITGTVLLLIISTIMYYLVVLLDKKINKQ